MRIIVTGASRGIGRALAERLGKPGHGLALCGSQPSPELDSIAESCRAGGAKVVTLTGDLGTTDVPAKLVAGAVEGLGGLDGVVSNAGVTKPGNLTDMSIELWERLFAINVTGPWLLARAAYPHLQKSGAAASFVSIASTSGVEPHPGLGNYSITKAAVIMMIRTLAQEWAASGVRANSVSPALFLSSMTAALYANPEIKAAREKLIPMHRIGDPARDLGGVVEFLLSPDSSYITGQNLVVDGGLAASILNHIPGRVSAAASRP